MSARKLAARALRHAAFYALAAAWTVLSLVDLLRLPRPEAAHGTAFALALLAVPLFAVGFGVAGIALSDALERVATGARIRLALDALVAVGLGLAATWDVLSRLKLRATREVLSFDDLRFLLPSLRQVGAEASGTERRLLALAIALSLGVATAAFLALRRSRRAVATGLGSPIRFFAVGVAALAAVAALGSIRPDTLRLLRDRLPVAHLLPRPSAVAALGDSPPDADAASRAATIAPWVAPESFRRDNVLVVMLESVPWSRLFGPAARPEATPRLLAAARESTVFARAYATATHSDYAQTSILASLHPRKFEKHDYFTDLSYPRTLVWDLFRPLGYRTGVFSCQNEGWGNMEAFLESPGLEIFRHAPDWPNAPRRGDGAESKVFEATPIDAFLEWLGEAPDRPFVAYLNFQATHYPYVVPPGEPEPFQPSAIDFPTTFLSYPREKIGVMENRFHNALASVDRQFGRLDDALLRVGVRDRTVLLVVSDHGEAFYEHGLPTHGTTLLEEQVRTAMFARIPGRAPATIERPVSVLDAIPSLVRELGLPPHGNFQGRSDAFVADATADADSGLRRPLWFTIQGMTFEDGLLLGDLKYVVNWSRRERALFDLAADPGETRNLAAERPEDVARLDRELSRIARSQLDYYRERRWERGLYPPRLP